MPIALLRAFATMLPRIDAEEQLSRMRIAAVGGSVSYELDAVTRMEAAFERLARGEDAEPKAARATPEQLAEIGVGVVMVEA